MKNVLAATSSAPARDWIRSVKAVSMSVSVLALRTSNSNPSACAASCASARLCISIVRVHE